MRSREIAKDNEIADYPNYRLSQQICRTLRTPALGGGVFLCLE